MSRTVTWTPAPGVLFTHPETAHNISEHVSVTVTGPAAPGGGTGDTGDTGDTGGTGGTGGTGSTLIPVDHYSSSIAPTQSVLSISADVAGVTVSAPTLAGLFPIRYIDYRKNNATHRIYDWNALPPQCRLVAFKPTTARQFTFTLTVTAHLTDGSTEQAAYSLIVTQDWTAGKIRLEAEVDARR